MAHEWEIIKSDKTWLRSMTDDTLFDLDTDEGRHKIDALVASAVERWLPEFVLPIERPYSSDANAALELVECGVRWARDCPADKLPMDEYFFRNSHFKLSFDISADNKWHWWSANYSAGWDGDEMIILGPAMAICLAYLKHQGIIGYRDLSPNSEEA